MLKKVAVFVCSALAVVFPGQQLAGPLLSTDMLNNLNTEYSAEAYRRGLAINKLLVTLKHQDIQKQLLEVNRFFNQFEYQEDHIHWGEQDYWATPSEFLGTQKGDCEDFVIAKYFALRALGVPDERLYLTYVKALKQNVAHMVLSYFPTPASIPQILDNYNPMIQRK